MDSLFLLVPLSVLVVGLAGAALLWAIGDGQFEDLESAGSHFPDQETLDPDQWQTPCPVADWNSEIRQEFSHEPTPAPLPATD